MRRTFGGMTLLTALALTGCVDTEAAPPSPEPSNESPAILAPDSIANFSQGLWTNEVEGRNKPLITPKHVITLVGNNIYAWGPNGQEAWKHQVPDFDDSTETSRTLKLVSSDIGDEAVPRLVTVRIQLKIEAPYTDDTEKFVAYDLETGDTIASSNLLATGVDTPPSP